MPKTQKIVIPAISLCILGLAVWALYTQTALIQTTAELNKTKNELTELKTNSPSPKNETSSLVESVSQLIALPKSEIPTIATVNDTSKLANQPFFKNAQIGDKVLIYKEAKRAILFRPSDNKVIEYAPLQTDEEQVGNIAGTSTTKIDLFPNKLSR